MVTLGDETISAVRIVLHRGEHRTVKAVAQITPATAALLRPPPDGEPAAPSPATVTLSAALGPIQGAILPTILPLLALKLYDAERTVLSEFDHLAIPVVPRDDVPEGEVPFAVAIATDGRRLTEHHPIVGGARLAWVGSSSRVALFAGWRRDRDDTVAVDFGSHRMTVAAPRVRGGLTVIGAATWPDGRLDLSIGLYRLPLGTSWDPEVARIPVEWIARALALAAPLFRAGVNLAEVPDEVLHDVASGARTDPVIGALAFHAHDRLVMPPAPGVDDAIAGPARQMQAAIRSKLRHYSGDLPDSRIIAALDTDRESRREALAAMLDDPDLRQPVLAASLAHLAQAAIEAGREDHWAVDRYDRIIPGQVFNVVRTS
jgi:hypothetical protein